MKWFEIVSNCLKMRLRNEPKRMTSFPDEAAPFWNELGEVESDDHTMNLIKVFNASF